MTGPPPPATARRRTAALAVAIVLGAGAVVGLVALLRPAPPRAPREDPYVVLLPTPVPRGDPVTPATALRAGDAFRGRGSFSYRREAAGTFGPAPRIAARVVGGTFVSTRRVSAAPDGRLTVAVEATLSIAGTTPREARLAFSFPDGVPGPMSTKEARLEVEDDLKEAVEPIVAAFTQKTPLPPGAVRVGDSFAPRDALDLEPMRRQVFQLFAYRTRGVAPVEGLVWVEGLLERPAGDALDVRVLLHHEQEGPVTEPGKPEIATAYEGVERARASIGIADGAPRDVEESTLRRLHVVGKDLDYRVEVALAASLVEERTAGR